MQVVAGERKLWAEIVAAIIDDACGANAAKELWAFEALRAISFERRALLTFLEDPLGSNRIGSMVDLLPTLERDNFAALVSRLYLQGWNYPGLRVKRPWHRAVSLSGEILLWPPEDMSARKFAAWLDAETAEKRRMSA